MVSSMRCYASIPTVGHIHVGIQDNKPRLLAGASNYQTLFYLISRKQNDFWKKKEIGLVLTMYACATWSYAGIKEKSSLEKVLLSCTTMQAQNLEW